MEIRWGEETQQSGVSFSEKESERSGVCVDDGAGLRSGYIL